MSLTNFTEFGWRAMTTAINQIPNPPSLFQDLIFKTRNTRPSEYVDVDVIIGGKKLVPFVSPIEGGTIIERLGQEVRSIRAPRLRPKKPFSAQELLTLRGLGSGFYASGAADISSARQQKLAYELQDLKNRINVTTEWMCGQALTGTLTVSQDNIAFAVDYNVPAAHKDTLTGTDLWTSTDAACDPLGKIQTWADLIINALGVGPSIMVMGTNAAAALMKNTKVLSALDNRRMENGAIGWKATSNYLGNLLGIDLYRYGSQYTDSSGTAQNVMAADYAVLVAPQARFSIEYGLILDLEAEAQVMAEFFSKSWMEKDPSVLWLLAESRPLPVPWQPESIVYAKVV